MIICSDTVVMLKEQHLVAIVATDIAVLGSARKVVAEEAGARMAEMIAPGSEQAKCGAGFTELTAVIPHIGLMAYEICATCTNAACLLGVSAVS